MIQIPPESPEQKTVNELRSKIRAYEGSGRRFAPGEYIELKCFNRADADSVRALLTEDEKMVVKFTWIGIPGMRKCVPNAKGLTGVPPRSETTSRAAYGDA